MGGAVTLPSVRTATEESIGHQYEGEQGQSWNPPGRRGELVLVRSRCVGFLNAAGQIVFGEQILFVQAEVLCDGADESTGKAAARELLPLLIFDGFEESRANASASGQLSERDFAHIAFAFQVFAEITFGHSRATCVYDTKGESNRRAKARHFEWSGVKICE